MKLSGERLPLPGIASSQRQQRLRWKHILLYRQALQSQIYKRNHLFVLFSHIKPLSPALNHRRARYHQLKTHIPLESLRLSTPQLFFALRSSSKAASSSLLTSGGEGKGVGFVGSTSAALQEDCKVYVCVWIPQHPFCAAPKFPKVSHLPLSSWVLGEGPKCLSPFSRAIVFIFVHLSFKIRKSVYPTAHLKKKKKTQTLYLSVADLRCCDSLR